MSDHDIGSVKAIIFDFDFTLADSSVPIVECVNFGLQGLGLPEASGDAIERTIGLHLSETLVVLAGEEQRPNADKFLALFGERADQIMADNTVIFPEVPEALDELISNDHLRMQLACNATQYLFSHRILAHSAPKWTDAIDALLDNAVVHRHHSE